MHVAYALHDTSQQRSVAHCTIEHTTMKNITIRPARDYRALSKAKRQAQWRRVKWSLLSWLGFIGYCLALALIAAAFYVVAVALMA